MHLITDCSGGGWTRPALGPARIIAGVILAVVLAGAVLADGTVTGRARFEKVKGKPQLGYQELYETNLFLSPDAGRYIGPSRRVGAPPGLPATHDGYYSITVPAGTCSLFLNQSLFFIAPCMVPGVLIEDGRTKTQNVELSIDYSTYFKDTWTVWDDVWAQTFVATGTCITGVSWFLAGTDASTIEASIHRDNGSANPLTWPLASSLASKRDSVGRLTDNWVRWRSGQVETVPGARYAVKLTGIDGGFAVFKRDKDANSYAGGRAYNKGGAAQNLDLNITVFSDGAGTAVIYNKMSEGLGDLRDGFFDNRWGQTFRATRGRSLAGVDVWAAGGDNHWDLDFTFRVRAGGLSGSQVGPVKTTKAAYQAFGVGLHAVSYSPGEVPLEPGQIYYVEFTNAEGFNPFVMNESGDRYDDGAAYQNGQLRDGGSVDLNMTILVHTEAGGTIAGRVTDAAGGAALRGATILVVEIGRSAESQDDGSYELRDVPAGTYTLRASRSGYSTRTEPGVEVVAGETRDLDFALEAQPCAVEFRNGSFEEGMTGWSSYGDARDRTVCESSWFGGISAFEGDCFHGNEINGCCLNGGLYQQFCSTPGHRYRVSTASNIYWIEGSSSHAASRIGADPSGGTDPLGGAIVWSAEHRQVSPATDAWSRISAVARADGPVMTLFLDFRQISAGGNQWRINCFDAVEIEDLDAGAQFRRGDCDSSAVLDISDAVFLLNHLFLGGAPSTCFDACDSNDDGAADLSDASFLLNYLFLGGRTPPEPGPDCGPDPTADPLGCDLSSC